MILSLKFDLARAFDHWGDLMAQSEVDLEPLSGIMMRLLVLTIDNLLRRVFQGTYSMILKSLDPATVEVCWGWDSSNPVRGRGSTATDIARVEAFKLGQNSIP